MHVPERVDATDLIELRCGVQLFAFRGHFVLLVLLVDGRLLEVLRQVFETRLESLSDDTLARTFTASERTAVRPLT
jgi:hypothetical protein